MPKKIDIKKLEKDLKFKPSLVWDKLSELEKKATFAMGEDYKAFLDAAKTEREAVVEIEKRALAAGFKPMGSAKKPGPVFAKFMEKTAALAIPGEKPITEGIRLIVSHIDSPRLDLKPNPLYESIDMAFLKTHYYGGIKKYQWLSRPLALHGRVIKSDGKAVDIIFGEDANDPVLTIADLLPHLAASQVDKKVTDAFPGEKLNLLMGSLPLGDDKVKERFKLAILQLLNEKYGLVEEDFLSAELEAVPAGKSRDVGLDKSLIGGYGQDDRVSAYASLDALVKVNKPLYTCLALFMDKEEIGSAGATGSNSRLLEVFLDDLFVQAGLNPSSAALRKALLNTKAISADVTAGLDPDFQEVHEKTNAARIGYGPSVTKYTGARGKSGASDASAEYVGWLRNVFNRNKVTWQTGELGKIDEGGGGTVALFFAKYGMEIVDCGVPLIGMHSPFEVSSKADVFMTRQAYESFYSAK
ncbi:MAG: aminopeptidase [Desulfobacteraceae bacterium]|nr:aminopeptidase [Desulfobacteraceae bacterium]